MKKQEKLQTSERPLSGAAARNLHGAASQAGGQGGREEGGRAAGASSPAPRCRPTRSLTLRVGLQWQGPQSEPRLF